MGMVGALRLPTLRGALDWFYGYGGCASLTHPTGALGGFMDMVGALRLPTLRGALG